MINKTANHPNETYMRLAIAEARKGFAQGQYAIGAVVVLRGEVLSVAHTTLDKERDPTCHAEVNAIRAAVKTMISRGSKADWSSILKGAWLYSTFESCSMCTSLAIWANMKGIVYGNTMQEFFKINNMRRDKSHYIFINSKEIAKRGNPRLTLHEGFLKDECMELLKLKH